MNENEKAITLSAITGLIVWFFMRKKTEEPIPTELHITSNFGGTLRVYRGENVMHEGSIGIDSPVDLTVEPGSYNIDYMFSND